MGLSKRVTRRERCYGVPAKSFFIARNQFSPPPASAKINVLPGPSEESSVACPLIRTARDHPEGLSMGAKAGSGKRVTYEGSVRAGIELPSGPAPDGMRSSCSSPGSVQPAGPIRSVSERVPDFLLSLATVLGELHVQVYFAHDSM